MDLWWCTTLATECPFHTPKASCPDQRGGRGELRGVSDYSAGNKAMLRDLLWWINEPSSWDECVWAYQGDDQCGILQVKDLIPTYCNGIGRIGANNSFSLYWNRANIYTCSQGWGHFILWFHNVFIYISVLCFILTEVSYKYSYSWSILDSFATQLNYMS